MKKIALFENELSTIKNSLLKYNVTVVDAMFTEKLLLKTEEIVDFSVKSFPTDFYDKIDVDESVSTIKLSVLDENFYTTLLDFVLKQPFKSIFDLNPLLHRIRDDKGKIVNYSLGNPFYVKNGEGNVWEYVELDNETNT